MLTPCRIGSAPTQGFKDFKLIMNIQVTPLSEVLGAEITGVDLSRELGPDAFDIINRAWLRHKVIVFPGQDMGEDDQVRFARLFGELQAVRAATHLIGEDQFVMHVANRTVDGKPGILPKGDMQFHVDQCYYESPCRATLLYAMEVPREGGLTLFLDTGKAYAALADGEKARLDAWRVLNVYDYGGNPTVKGDDVDKCAPRFVHPLVVLHPVTGERLLFANRLMSVRIEGLDGDESRRILDRLYDHAEQLCFIFEHAWKPGDLVMWDNLAAMHARTDFDPAERRVLRRVTVKGPRPLGVNGRG